MRKSLNFEVKEDAATLRKMLKQQKAPLPHARLLALYLYKTEQCGYRKDIAQQVGYGRNAVGRWLQTYETHGLEAMLTVGASGNPSELSIPPAVLEMLEKRLHNPNEGFASYKAVHQWLAQEHGVAEFMEKRQGQLPVYKSLDKGHGRGEERNVQVASQITLVDEAEQWKDLHSLAMVERVRHTNKGVTRKVQYYISSLEPTAEQMAHYVREHWAIENKLHWQLDFTFGEDDSRVRKNNGPANLRSVRKWALHLLKKDSRKISIKRKRKKAARSGEYLKQILTG